MKEMFFAAAITFCAAVMIFVATKRGYEVEKLEQQVTELERQVQARQLMLNDLHRIVPIMERRVAKVDTEMTAREVIWHLQEAIGNCENVEVY